MSLSFEDSLKQNSENNVATTAESASDDVSAAVATMDIDSGETNDVSVMTLSETYAVAAYSGDDGSWFQHPDYDIYSFLEDDNISNINSQKEIKVNENQVNITQEENSQYIPFQMPRFYDGFDLVGTTISIHYETANKYHGAVKPVNVSYNNEYIRFGWLVDAGATQAAGKIKFEIHAHGLISNANGESKAYTWKTKYNESLNVLESICGADCDGNINIDDTWVQELVTSVVENIAGKIVDAEVGEQVRAAEDAATRAEAAATNAESTVSGALTDYAKTSEVQALVGDLGESESVVEYVDTVVDGVDVTEQLTNYVTTETLESNYYNKSDTDAKVAATLENYATKDDVSDAISSADLDSYYKKDETYNKDEVDEKLSNVDLTGYATEAYVNTKTATLSSAIETNTDNIASLGNTISDLQDTIDSVDTSPRLTYDVAYNDADDPDVGENVFVLYEITNENEENEQRSAKKKFTITGGSGGSATSSSLKIGYVTTSPLVVTTNDRAVITYTFSGTDSSGDIVPEGVATWKIGSKLIATNTALAGENSFDVTDYISIGSQKILLTITDDAGSLVTKTWTVQQIDVKLESDFNDTITYPLGDVSFNYKPYGSIDKTVHFILDGEEIGTVDTKVSGIPMSYTLSSQSHGAHLVEAYITAELNGSTIESNHIFKDVIWYDSSSSIPVIGCTQQNITTKQYDSTNITYTVYDPNTETPTVTLAVDGEVVSTLTLSTATNIWQYKSSDVGEHVLTITCGETVKTINIVVEELDINVSPVTAGLAFDFNPTGLSNNSANRLWSDGDVTMTVSDNFDWTNGGYQIDEDGDQYFCVKSGTSAVIDYNLFADDPKKNGKELKIVFKTTNVKNRDTSFISCLDNNIGFDMKVESAYIYSSNDSLYSPYCEDDIIEFEFNINKNTDIPMVLTYEDGVANRPMIYTSDTSFMQSTPQPITIGSDDCDVHIYRIKAYSNSLNDSDILSNFIADARNADEMIARYNRNQIYDENGLLTPEVLAEKCPDLRIIMVDCPRFTTDKSDKVSDTSVTMIYKNGDPVLDNWTCTGAKVSGQGTSSNEYGYAGRNLDLIMDGDDALFTLGDGETTSKTITLTRNSTPTDYLNFKCNIASSENQNNALMTMRFNEYQPYIRPARLKDSKVRDTMEFHNAVVFVREYNEDLSTHNEFNDSDSFHYYALGNIGDSKKTDDSRTFDKNDPKEFCIEVMDYNVALAEFPTGYTDSDGNKAICPESEWKKGNTAYDYLYADYKYKDGEFKSFGSESYEFRYEKKGITEDERQANIDAWREAYKFVVTSDDETFKSDFNKYFVQDSILYFYLFTERYTLVDNRAKNSFYHYSKAY